MTRPLLITLGDPVGIGPELVARLLDARDAALLGVPLRVVGSRRVWERARACVGAHVQLPDADLAASLPAGSPPWGLWDPGTPAESILAELPYGRPDARAGAASHAWVVAAAEAAHTGQAAGMVTGPIHKEAWQAAGVQGPGHTEVVQRIGGGGPVLMMLAGGRLRAALATAHVPLREVPGRLTTPKLTGQIKLLHRSMQQTFALAAPRLAVAGLNPHAGEGGLLGHEDRAVIAPAVAAARAEGVDVRGPLPADACIPHAAAGGYDAVLAMYHDQALPAVKAIAPRCAVNVTLGLPFVRTSVDHGTAFDIAGQGTAAPTSLRHALVLAIDCVTRTIQ